MERKYRSLIVWREADDLCVSTYQITKKFPQDERYNLIAQMRSSAQSVPTNIVEGNARKHRGEQIQFFNIASASLEELHYQYHLSSRLGYIDNPTLTTAHNHIHRISYLLMRFTSALRGHKEVSS